MKTYIGNTRYKILDANGRRMMMAANVNSGSALPYDRIEYLQSNGVDTQYIQLPINVQEGLDIYCKFSIVEASSYGYIFGNQESGTNYLIVRQNGTSGKIQVMLVNGSSGATESLSHIGDIRDIHIHLWNESQTCLLDDTTLLNKTESYNNTSNFKIRLWSPASAFKGKVRIYSFSVYLHDALVLDLIPVKDNGVGYMYDKVSGQLFGNSGSGSFILGNDK